MKMFDNIKKSIKGAQDKAKGLGSSAKASMKRATESAKGLGKKSTDAVKKFNPFGK
jgi:hypothetical protein